MVTSTRSDNNGKDVFLDLGNIILKVPSPKMKQNNSTSFWATLSINVYNWNESPDPKSVFFCFFQIFYRESVFFQRGEGKRRRNKRRGDEERFWWDWPTERMHVSCNETFNHLCEPRPKKGRFPIEKPGIPGTNADLGSGGGSGGPFSLSVLRKEWPESSVELSCLIWD